MPRTSNLMAPIMLLSGHDGEIYTAMFSPDGSCLASAGFDMAVCMFFLFVLTLNFCDYCEYFELPCHLDAIYNVNELYMKLEILLISLTYDLSYRRYSV